MTRDEQVAILAEARARLEVEAARDALEVALRRKELAERHLLTLSALRTTVRRCAALAN